MEPTTPTTTPPLHDAKELDKLLNKIKFSISDIAKTLKLSKNTIARAEKQALDKIRLGLTSTEDNTHLLAHDPSINEIDNLFLAQPWMMWLRLPPAEGSRIVRFISRGEWEKSRD